MTQNASTIKSWLRRQLSRSLVAPLQIRSELRRFRMIVRDLSPSLVLEIGRCRGETLFLLARSCQRGARLVSLDMQPLSFTRTTIIHAFIGKTRTIQLLTADSHSPDTLRSIGETLQGQHLDLLFIDGDHSYEGVKRDFDMYSPLVRRGGVVAFHDIAEHPPSAQCEVSRFWHEAKGSYRYVEIIENERQGWAGIGVLYL